MSRARARRTYTRFCSFIFKAVRARLGLVYYWGCLFELGSFIFESVHVRLVFGSFKLNELVREHTIREHIIKPVHEHINKLVREQIIFKNI